MGTWAEAAREQERKEEAEIFRVRLYCSVYVCIYCTLSDICVTPHTFMPWRGMCNLKWGRGRKREEERSEVEGGGKRVGLKRSSRTGRLETGDTG